LIKPSLLSLGDVGFTITLIVPGYVLMSLILDIHPSRDRHEALSLLNL